MFIIVGNPVIPLKNEIICIYRLLLLTSLCITNAIHVLFCSIITHNKWDCCTEYIQ